MAYKWNGAPKRHDATSPAPAPVTTEPLEGNHGTVAGYHAHCRAGERGADICQPCRDARNAKKRELRAAKGLKPGRPAIYGTGCGSPAGYTTHLRHGERPCDPCRAAYNARKVEYLASRKAAA